ncbi:hypothetical protein LRD18_03050 [Halorhodospira halochloris]|uniref:hypothetical protein n=1 Tax=Halorhodospira halochloris TaxID=1052 RepID=UPI001EE82DB5|nr:hypothetical protein [Halorhodospira halochloris]MCG5529852.1 hypothetical protein [Halorhodospira halochloris]
MAPEKYKNATRVVVDFERDGYVLGSRTFRNLQGDEDLNLSISLLPEDLEVLSIDNGVSISSTGERVLRFGVVRGWDGERRVIAGDVVGVAAANSGNGAEDL